MAPVMEVNLRALAGRAPEHPARARYRDIAEIVTGRHGAEAVDGVAWMRDLCQALGVRGLGHHGLAVSEIPALVDKAKAASSMRGNPVQLSNDELGDIVRGAL
jgi:alcohol dehydrogenase class IV